jgi:GTP-binding protein HflX
VVDISDKDHRFKIQEVDKILKELGLSDKPKIRVNNKCDKLDFSDLEELSKNSLDQVWLSSKTLRGFESLFDTINLMLKGKITSNWVALDAELGWLRAELYSSGGVLEERISDEGLIELHLESFQNDLIKLLEVEGFTLIEEKQTQEAI